MRYCPTSVYIYPRFQPEICRMWDMPPARQYLSIRPYGRRYRIWDIEPCPCPSIHFSNPEIWIWDRPPARRRCGMCHCAPPTQAKFLHGITYLSIPFLNPKYRMWDLTPARQCLSIPCSRRYIGCGILPHVSIYLSPFPARSIGHGGYGIWPRVSF